MIGWIIFAAWAIGWLGFSVTITRLLREDWTQDIGEAEAMDRVVMIFAAMCIALPWPLVIPGGWIYKRVFGDRKGGADE